MTLSSRLGLPAWLAPWPRARLSSDGSEIELVLSFRRIGADCESRAELEHCARLILFRWSVAIGIGNLKNNDRGLIEPINVAVHW